MALSTSKRLPGHFHFVASKLYSKTLNVATPHKRADASGEQLTSLLMFFPSNIHSICGAGFPPRISHSTNLLLFSSKIRRCVFCDCSDV